MEPRYLALLPDELKAVVGDIEALAGCSIDVRRDDTSAAFDNLEVGFTQGGRCDATIRYRGDDIRRWALIHEVLHLKRWWLDQVPALITRLPGPIWANDATRLNDMLEHLIVIPEEQRFVGEESQAHWRGLLAGCIATLPEVPANAPRAERVALMRSLFDLRATYEIALGDEISAELKARLEAAGMLERSAVFVEQLRRLLANKEQCLQYAVEALEFNRQGFMMGKFVLTPTSKDFQTRPL